MRKPCKFVSFISDEDIKFLENLIKKEKKFRIRRRAHVILSSSQGLCIDKISEKYKIHRDTVSRYIDAWKKSGRKRLADLPKSGRNPKLKGHDLETAKKIIEEFPQFPRKIIAEIREKTGITISHQTLRRTVKKLKMRWKRIRKSLKKQRPEKAFRKAEQEIRELIIRHMSNKDALFFFDQTGFSAGSYVPYAYQPIGKTLEISAVCRKRLNVAGFFTPDNRLISFCFEHNTDSKTVIACFDKFAEYADTEKKTVVILDNSPLHHSDEFYEKIPEWEKKGIFLKYLPPYSPELNRIEILWKSIKYRWLDISSYTSFENMVRNVEHILINIKRKYSIEFS